jgi:hypothetical protein
MSSRIDEADGALALSTTRAQPRGPPTMGTGIPGTSLEATETGLMARDPRINPAMIWHDGPGDRGLPLDDDERRSHGRVLDTRERV